MKELIRKTEESYNDYLSEHNGTEPRFAFCDIKWKEDGAIERMTIKLNSMLVENEDEYIFFYCDGLTDLCRLMEEDNGEDFYIIGEVEFSDEI